MIANKHADSTATFTSIDVEVKETKEILIAKRLELRKALQKEAFLFLILFIAYFAMKLVWLQLSPLILLAPLGYFLLTLVKLVRGIRYELMRLREFEKLRDDLVNEHTC